MLDSSLQNYIDWRVAQVIPVRTGFGYSLAMGVREAVSQYGIWGVLSGGLTATAAGIASAIFFGFNRDSIFILALRPASSLFSKLLCLVQAACRPSGLFWENM